MEARPRIPDASVNVSPTHPLGEAAWLVGGIGAVAVLAFVVVAFFVEIAVRFVPVESEARLLETLLQGIDADWDAEPELDGLVARLASHWSDNPYHFRVRIMPDPEPNALALPGGTVLVTSSLLEQAESENELAFVLAHEIGHYRNRDHLELLGRGIVFQVLLSAVGIGGGPDAARVVGASALMSARSFSRGQERDADAFALDLVEAEYGHVNGATEFFERLEERTGEAEELAASFVGTHPGVGERVRELEALTRERGWSSAGELRPRIAVAGQPSP